MVDQFNYAGAGAQALTVTGDGVGNVYVGGIGHYQYQSGYSHNKPTYIIESRSLVRKSGSGNSGSWSTDSDFLPDFALSTWTDAIAADSHGNVYVASGGSGHIIVRTTSGASWTISDDYAGIDGPTYVHCGGLTVDSYGNVYEGGDDLVGTYVRSMPAPAPAGASVSTTMSNSPFSSSLIPNHSVKHDAVIELIDAI
jgi:hypothetical protein